MASPNGADIAQCFKKGAIVEISSNDKGFRGSWYEGTVIRPPRNVKRGTEKVLVEYNNLMEDEGGKRRLKEEFELVDLRPPPPKDLGRRRFKFSDAVDAYYNDGWWEGIIVEVAGEDKYLVFFRGTMEQLEFRGSELRIHREWVHGKWVPPLERENDSSQDEKIPMPAEMMPKKEEIEHNFSPGAPVEISIDDKDFEDAWYAATIIRKLNEGKYLVEYQTLRNDDDSNFLTEEVDSVHIRPCPPDIGLVDRFAVHEEVDALYNDGWWVGVIAKVLKDDKYFVYFRTTDQTLKYKHTDLRVHQEWVNGRWVIAPKAMDL